MGGGTGDNVYVHFGRGGAGNITNTPSSETRRPGWSVDSQSTRREVGGRRFSTGVGGTGNIMSANKLDRQHEADDMAQLMHDMQTPGFVLVEGGHHTGIGGAANRYRPTDAETNEARLNNDNLRRQSVASVQKRRESMASMYPNSFGGRRTSMAESMKDFFMGAGRRMSKA